MKRLLLFFLIIYLFTDFSLTQTIKSFKQLGYYGIKNKITGQILIKPKYKSIEQISDSMIVVVDTNNNYAIIDTLENILLPYSNYCTAFIDFDSINNGKFVEHPYRNDKSEISGYWYIVDKNRYCIPHDYYPCPHWKSLSNDTIPEYLSLIQKAIFYKSMNMIDSAILLCDEAINIEPTNPYVYFARALISIIDKRYKYIKNIKDVSEKEKNIITEYLEAAEKYENNSYYLVLITSVQNKF